MDIIKAEEYLQVLINQQVRFMGKNENKVRVTFGEWVEGKNSNSGYKKIHRSHLNIFSSFRVLGSNGTERLFGTADAYVYTERNEISLLDERIEAWIRNNLIVADVSINIIGDLKIYFKNGDVLEVFCDTSADEELWEFCDRKDNRGYVIVTGQNIYWEQSGENNECCGD